MELNDVEIKDLLMKAKSEINPRINYMKRISESIYELKGGKENSKEVTYIIEVDEDSINLVCTKGILN